MKSAFSQPSPHLFHQSPPTCRYLMPLSASSPLVTLVPSTRPCGLSPLGAGVGSDGVISLGRKWHVLQLRVPSFVLQK